MKISIALASWIFAISIFVAVTVSSRSAMSAAPDRPRLSNFDPSGRWSIRFEDRCSGSSRYSNSAITINGSEFKCSSYLEENQPPERDELEIRYDPTTRTATLTGGPSPFPRAIHLDPDGIGVSDAKLFPTSSVQAKGCVLETYKLETVRFRDANRMDYGYITVHRFIPRSEFPGCAPYLSELKSAIRTRTATGLLLAMRDINAINVNQLQNLSILNLFSNYTGVRRDRGYTERFKES